MRAACILGVLVQCLFKLLNHFDFNYSKIFLNKSNLNIHFNSNKHGPYIFVYRFENLLKVLSFVGELKIIFTKT